MEAGYLNKYFSGVVVKRLSEVEVNTETSNQHEFNARKPMPEIFGTEVPKNGRRRNEKCQWKNDVVRCQI